MREVDDALREDDMLRAVKRWGLPVLAVAMVGLGALGGYLWWGHSRDEAAGKRGEQLVIALDQLEGGRSDVAGSQIAQLAADSNGRGSQALAKMLQADIALQQGKKDQAAGIYAALAADAAMPKPYRDLAIIREVAVRFDTLKPEEVVSRLRPLAIPGNPWFGSAGELLGMAYLKQGQKDLAAPLFGAIAKDKNVPDTLRARSRQVAGELGFDAIDDIARAPAGTQ